MALGTPSWVLGLAKSSSERITVSSGGEGDSLKWHFKTGKGPPYMTSANFWDFLTPPPCHCHKSADFFLLSAFWGPPTEDVIHGSLLRLTCIVGETNFGTSSGAEKLIPKPSSIEAINRKLPSNKFTTGIVS